VRGLSRPLEQDGKALVLQSLVDSMTLTPPLSLWPTTLTWPAWPGRP